MVYQLRVFLLLLFVWIGYEHKESYAQGCSDAGFCTMGAMKPNQPFYKKASAKVKSIELSQYLGLTKFNDEIHATTVDVNVAFSPKLQAQIKLPYMYVNGPMGSTNGIGDLTLSVSRNVYMKENLQINMTLGSKIPTNKGNIQDAEGRSLPMYYQSSLGTYDFVIGGSIISKNWLFAAGYQQALNKNDNGFLWGIWENSSVPREIFTAYPASNQLLRGKDVMMRVEYNLRFTNWNVNLGLLPIYRFTKDEIEKGGKTLKVDGSEGLALSGLFGAGYKINARHGLKWMGGVRLTKRESNPDGLSREQVLTMGYEYKFF